jgi:hypothetical protein
MASEPVARAVVEEVARWGAMRQTGVSLRYMMEFGARPTERTLLLAAQFLHKELPIRIARRALDLESLPFGLSSKPAILKVDFLHPRAVRPPSLPNSLAAAGFGPLAHAGSIPLKRFFLHVESFPCGLA